MSSEHENERTDRGQNQPELMRVTDAADLLGVSRKTMTRMLRDGELTVVGLDPIDHRAKLVRRADVEAILRQAARPPRKKVA
jgi:excisionase family DNA binding protein